METKKTWSVKANKMLKKKKIVQCESTSKEAFEQSAHRRISSIDSKVRTAL